MIIEDITSFSPVFQSGVQEKTLRRNNPFVVQTVVILDHDEIVNVYSFLESLAPEELTYMKLGNFICFPSMEDVLIFKLRLSGYRAD